jgi:mitochondrial distribution and morphology protein 31
MSSHLRHRLCPHALVSLRRQYSYSVPSSAHLKQSKCSFPRTRSRSTRLPLLRTPYNRRFASPGIRTPEVSSLARMTSWRTTPQTIHAGKILCSARPASQPISSLAQQAWRVGIHSKSRNQEKDSQRRDKSSTSSSGNDQNPAKDDNRSSPVPPTARKVESSFPDSSPSSSKYLHLPHLPKLPHRPTKEELLAAATGFWSRLKVRFKWFSIRSVRPWNVDDWSAFVSWFVLGNIVWVLVGTTTFFSLVILSINTVVAQGKLSIMKAKNTETDRDYRNTGQMGRRLSDAFGWYKSCLRACHCSEMGRWRDHIPQRFRIEETRTGKIQGQQGIFNKCGGSGSS